LVFFAYFTRRAYYLNDVGAFVQKSKKGKIENIAGACSWMLLHLQTTVHAPITGLSSIQHLNMKMVKF
jgi:hypothetical protein